MAYMFDCVDPVKNECWINFFYAHFQQGLGTFEIWDTLKKEYNGKDIPFTSIIEFESEEDAVRFLLRWG